MNDDTGDLDRFGWEPGDIKLMSPEELKKHGIEPVAPEPTTDEHEEDCACKHPVEDAAKPPTRHKARKRSVKVHVHREK